MSIEHESDVAVMEPEPIATVVPDVNAGKLAKFRAFISNANDTESKQTRRKLEYNPAIVTELKNEAFEIYYDLSQDKYLKKATDRIHTEIKSNRVEENQVRQAEMKKWLKGK